MKQRISSRKNSNIQGNIISNNASINEDDTGFYTFSELITLPNDSLTKGYIVNDGQNKEIDTTIVKLNKNVNESSSNDKRKKSEISEIVLSNNHLTNTKENISLVKYSYNDPTTSSSQISPSKGIDKKINSIRSIENSNHNMNVDIMKGITTKYVKYTSDDSEYKIDKNNNNNILRMKKIINENLKTCNISKNNIYPILQNVDLISKFSYEEKLSLILSYFDCDNDGIISKVDINLFINQLIAYIEGENKLNDSIQNILLTLNKEMVYDNNENIIIQDAINIIKNNDVIKTLLEPDVQSINDTNHQWTFIGTSSKLYCGVCRNRTSVLSKKKSFECKFCSFFCHQSCLNEAPNNCITDYVTIKEDITTHHWLEISQKKRCNNCFLIIKPFQGKRCRWCHETFHQKCIKNAKKCTYGCYNNFILPRDWCEKNINTGKVDIITKDVNRKPVLVLINPKSGGNEGNKIFKQFLQLLHPRQVYSLDEITPQQAIDNFKEIKNFRILVGGGDGTITWVQETLDKYNFENDKRPPIMVLPIGTGNDLSRSLKWGGGVIKIKPLKYLRKMEKSKIVYLDRWKLDIYDVIKVNDSESETKLPAVTFSNYFSIGIDAQICHRFHSRRQTNPELFRNRTRNKLHYIEFGAIEVFSNSWNEFSHEIEIICDDNFLNLQDIELEGICILNTPFIHGGTNMSHNKKKSICVRVENFLKKRFHGIKNDQNFTPKCIDDGLIEIIGFKNMFHLISLRSGIKEPLSLAQVRKIHIKTKKPFPMQIDGEPWLQDPCDIIISHHNKVPMFMKK